MRKVIVLAVCAIFLMAGSALAAPIKVAHFDLQKIATESDVYKEAQRVFKATFDPRKAELDRDGQAVQAKADSLRGVTPTEAQRSELARMQADYQNKVASYVEDLRAAEDRMRMDVDSVIVEAARNYASKKGYNLILDSADAIYSDNVYSSNADDVTRDMLTEVNAQWRSMRR